VAVGLLKANVETQIRFVMSIADVNVHVVGSGDGGRDEKMFDC
jgi:hypothetical protein